MHLPQAGGGKSQWVELLKQHMGVLAQLLAQHLHHQRPIQRRDLVMRPGQLMAHAFGQKAQFHAQQLGRFEGRALELVKG